MLKKNVTPITLHDAAQKYGITQVILRDLGRTGKIIMTNFKGDPIFDDDSIAAYLSLQDKLDKYDAYLESILAEKEEDVSNTIAIYDDYLFSMRTLDKTLPIFPIVINELSLLIKDDITKDIFLHVALGKSINKLAHKYSLTYDKICSIYDYAISTIQHRAGLINIYKNCIMDLTRKVRILELEKNNLQCHISQSEVMREIMVKDIKEIPNNALHLLSLNIRRSFNFDQRIPNSLQGQQIYTVEDLLRYICRHNRQFNSLLQIDNLGLVCLKKIRSTFLKHNIIDKNDYSYLYEYLL